MNSTKISVSKVCKLNRETIRSNNQPDYINYLDTGNITRNKIDEIKKLINGIDKYPSRAQRKVQKNTIIYSTVRPEQEHFGIIENPIDNLIVSTGFTTLDVIDDAIDAKYLYYSLTNKSITAYLNVIATNNVTSYPSLNPSDIGDLVLKIPSSKTEQQKIAKVLSDLDAKIELNNKINAALEAMAKTLYDYWFVQFDFPAPSPSGRAGVGSPYKTSGGKMVWHEELKREIPEGWEVMKLSLCCDIIDCLHSKKSDYYYEDKDYYLLQLENIKDDGLIDLSSKYFVSKDEYKRWTTRIEVKDHDLVITNAGRVAGLSQIPKYIVAGIGRNITAIRPKTIQPTFLYYAFQGNEMKRQIKLNTDTGTFFQSLNVRGIKELLVVRPPKYLEERFESIAIKNRRKRELNNFENQELASLRDWLLPMLMNGQVSVGEVAKDYEVKDEFLGMVADGNEVYKKE